MGPRVINKEYNAAMLARRCASWKASPMRPATDIYWQHGHSTERDFIYVTTQT